MFHSIFGMVVEVKQMSTKGQAGEEEVHGGVDVGVQSDGQDDEQVSKHSDQVHGQEKSRYEGLQFWIFRKSQEKKFWNLFIICWIHEVEVTIGKKENLISFTEMSIKM